MTNLWKGALCAFAIALFQGAALAQPVNAPAFPALRCASSATYDTNTSGSTELVALVTGRAVYVCGYAFQSAGTVSVKLIAGTGTACATGSSNLTPAYALVAQGSLVDGTSEFRGLKTPISEALCLNTTAAVVVKLIVYYSQF